MSSEDYIDFPLDDFVRQASKENNDLPNYDGLYDILDHLESKYADGVDSESKAEAEESIALLETAVWHLVEPASSASRQERLEIKTSVADPVKPEARRGNYDELRRFVKYLEDKEVTGIAGEVK